MQVSIHRIFLTAVATMSIAAAACLAYAERPRAAPQNGAQAGQPVTNPAPSDAPATNTMHPWQGPAFSGTASEAGQAAWGSQQLQAHLLQMAIGANQAEISLAQLAQTKAQTPEVKQFAEQMIRDHTQFVQQLQQFAQTGSGQPALQNPAVDAASNPQAAAAAAGATPAAGQATAQVPTPARGVSLFTVASQIQQRTGELMRNELNQQQGIRFDQAYIGQQIGAHLHMLAALETARKFVSPAAQQLLDAGIRTTTDHLNLARNTMQQLESGVARQPGQPNSAGPTRE
jgi:predicted outer membrane protein